MLEDRTLLPLIELRFLLLSRLLWQLQPFQQMATCLAVTPSASRLDGDRMLWRVASVLCKSTSI